MVDSIPRIPGYASGNGKFQVKNYKGRRVRCCGLRVTLNKQKTAAQQHTRVVRPYHVTQRCATAAQLPAQGASKTICLFPHLTLTLSPPIQWERRGDSKRTSLILRNPKGKQRVQEFYTKTSERAYVRCCDYIVYRITRPRMASRLIAPKLRLSQLLPRLSPMTKYSSGARHQYSSSYLWS